MREEDYKELCGSIKDIAENAIQSSTVAFLDDSIHKEGLVASLKDILELIKEKA